MRVLITGAQGFIAKNLRQRLAERADVEVVNFTRKDSVEDLRGILENVDYVCHLAGVNRPESPDEFRVGNTELTAGLAATLMDVAERTGRRVPVLYASSTQAALDNTYGISKRDAEDALLAATKAGVPVFVFRLPNVFGKWCRPNYNSVVATFCYNTALGQALHVNDPSSPITLAYIDDVVDSFVSLIDGHEPGLDSAGFASVAPLYHTTVGELARQIRSFGEGRAALLTERVGTGLTRALYATYVSYLPTSAFSYAVPQYADQRGVFVEMLKTKDSGQFSFFTAFPGVVRGGHYHHSKTEKFLVIKGHARFRFRHIQTGEAYELETTGEKPEIVNTVPGWTHDIANVGTDELIVMLWANEVFDRSKPDTYVCPL